ncbi:MAG: Gfo/Idh/MocA family oxidoreductase [Pirellulales bacterium]|nr:Gfo/Idh/MocA family oxidoreductase [Pirellulales bacterium]
MPSSTITRRRFFQAAIAAQATFSSLRALPSLASQNKQKNDRPGAALVGCGGQGTGDAASASRFCDIVAVCDVDSKQAQKAKKGLGGKADIVSDYRKLFERKDIDVIINGTPDHWHTKINIDACRAGKDVYAEKPLTLTIDEGQKLCKVVEETGRVVQVGTQQRSERQFQTAVELVRNGRIGKLKQVWVALPWYSTKGGPFDAQPVPAGFDWDVYQGQAPVRDYCPQRTHKTFRWFYIYAGGIVTDWGNHHIDIAHWGMDCENTGPVSVDARGMFPNEGKPNCFNTADRFFSKMAYANGVELLYFSSIHDKRTYGTEPCVDMSDQQRQWLFGKDTHKEIQDFNRNGIMFIGEKGRLFVNRGGIYGKVAEELKENPLPGDAWRVPPSADHMANFVECVKSRKTPVSTVAIQHRTITACHLTNISLRLKRKLKWDPAAQRIIGDKEADSWRSREQRAPYGIS